VIAEHLKPRSQGYRKKICYQWMSFHPALSAHSSTRCLGISFFNAAFVQVFISAAKIIA